MLVKYATIIALCILTSSKKVTRAKKFDETEEAHMSNEQLNQFHELEHLLAIKERELQEKDSVIDQMKKIYINHTAESSFAEKVVSMSEVADKPRLAEEATAFLANLKASIKPCQQIPLPYIEGPWAPVTIASLKKFEFVAFKGDWGDHGAFVYKENPPPQTEPHSSYTVCPFGEATDPPPAQEGIALLLSTSLVKCEMSGSLYIAGPWAPVTLSKLGAFKFVAFKGDYGPHGAFVYKSVPFDGYFTCLFGDAPG